MIVARKGCWELTFRIVPVSPKSKKGATRVRLTRKLRVNQNDSGVPYGGIKWLSMKAYADMITQMETHNWDVVEREDTPDKTDYRKIKTPELVELVEDD